jgi:hypothetical protein
VARSKDPEIAALAERLLKSPPGPRTLRERNAWSSFSEVKR